MTILTSRRVLTAIGVACLALAATACGSSTPAASTAPPATNAAPAAPASAAAFTVMLKTARTSLGTVLVDGAGFTVYWFAKDTAGTSACSGACAAAWPPVLGMPQAASGVKLTGKFGDIMRPDGQMQATYDGHPLYLFAGDTSPGQVKGNGINGFGALWWAIKVGASTAASTTHTGTSGSGGGSGGGGSGGAGW
jgi:predicted lipoprotein with Yx(FWY)xxD motif